MNYNDYMGENVSRNPSPLIEDLEMKQGTPSWMFPFLGIVDIGISDFEF